MKYLYRSPLVRSLFAGLDGLGNLLFFSRQPAKLPQKPERTLLINFGHLGDFLTALPFIYLFKQKAGGKITLLTGSWNREIAEVFLGRLYDKVIFYDDCLLDRGSKSRREKVLANISAIKELMAQLRAGQFDLGINLRPYLSQGNILLKLARTKYSIGFANHGFGFLLDRPVAFDPARHLQENLFYLWPRAEKIEPGYAREELALLIKQFLGRAEGIGPDTTVVQPFSANPGKNLAPGKWSEIIAGLGKVAFIGDRTEGERIEKEMKSPGNKAINLAGKLSLADSIKTIAAARAFIGIDSIGGHIAALLGKPGVVIFSGEADPAVWRPYSDRIKVVYNNDDGCFPCYNAAKCDDRSCIDKLDPGQIIRLFKETAERA